MLELNEIPSRNVIWTRLTIWGIEESFMINVYRMGFSVKYNEIIGIREFLWYISLYAVNEEK